MSELGVGFDKRKQKRNKKKEREEDEGRQYLVMFGEREQIRKQKKMNNKGVILIDMQNVWGTHN